MKLIATRKPADFGGLVYQIDDKGLGSRGVKGNSRGTDHPLAQFLDKTIDTSAKHRGGLRRISRKTHSKWGTATFTFSVK